MSRAYRTPFLLKRRPNASHDCFRKVATRSLRRIIPGSGVTARKINNAEGTRISRIRDFNLRATASAKGHQLPYARLSTNRLSRPMRKKETSRSDVLHNIWMKNAGHSDRNPRDSEVASFRWVLTERIDWKKKKLNKIFANRTSCLVPRWNHACIRSNRLSMR